MKVVLFCGGLGLRLRDHSERIPKPMAPIGYRPILWHVMKYYAHFGHPQGPAAPGVAIRGRPAGVGALTAVRPCSG